MGEDEDEYWEAESTEDQTTEAGRAKAMLDLMLKEPELDSKGLIEHQRKLMTELEFNDRASCTPN